MPRSWEHCPKCGRWVSAVMAELECDRIVKVTAFCAVHGEVDLTSAGWSAEDFEGMDDAT